MRRHTTGIFRVKRPRTSQGRHRAETSIETLQAESLVSNMANLLTPASTVVWKRVRDDLLVTIDYSLGDVVGRAHITHPLVARYHYYVGLDGSLSKDVPISEGNEA